MQARAPVTAALLAVLLLSAGARGQSAEEAEYVVDGAEAWAEASRAGFEFYPVIPDDRFILAGPRDGAWTALKSCTETRGPCRTEAQVLEGQLVVLECEGGCDRAHEFRLFSGRALAPGWSLREVDLAGGAWSWVRRPSAGSADASFAVRLEPAPGSAATVTVRSIRLAGPPEADWRAAFAE